MKDLEMKRRYRVLMLMGLAALAVVIIFCVLGWMGIGIPCLFRKMTGLLCPGCGNSRAVLSLLKLDLKAAFFYNMLFPLEFFYIGWVLFHCIRSYLKTGKFSYWPKKIWLDVLILIAVLLWWIIRNLI